MKISIKRKLMRNRLSDAASGMAYLELLGMVHCDLTASNVMVYGDDIRPRAKIADFGSSRPNNSGFSHYEIDRLPVRWMVNVSEFLVN
jgi:serine/threonine protein kinase